nr:MAG TPA: hypothetical protein [Caudoviricetes sp.]
MIFHSLEEPAGISSANCKYILTWLLQNVKYRGVK